MWHCQLRQAALFLISVHCEFQQPLMASTKILNLTLSYGYYHPSPFNKWYLSGTVPISHIHIIFTVYIVYKPPREWVQWL